MLVEEIVEGYKQVWTRDKTGVKRKYRCTSGQKKGRVVAKPSTCSTPVKQGKSIRAKKTRRHKSTSLYDVGRFISSKPLTSLNTFFFMSMQAAVTAE